jgi:hypothetical protein
MSCVFLDGLCSKIFKPTFFGWRIELASGCVAELLTGLLDDSRFSRSAYTQQNPRLLKG